MTLLLLEKITATVLWNFIIQRANNKFHKGVEHFTYLCSLQKDIFYEMLC
jgi:hypothetical protein